MIAWATMRPRRGAGSNLRPRVVVVARGSQAGFGAPRRISPLPPGPPYGAGLGPALSATALTTATGACAEPWWWLGSARAGSRRASRVTAAAPTVRCATSARRRRRSRALTARARPGGKVLIVWGARETQGPARVLISRAAIAAPGAPFATRVLEGGVPLDPSAPQAYDQFGPPTRAVFQGETPIAAWQTVVEGRSAVRRRALGGRADGHHLHRGCERTRHPR